MVRPVADALQHHQPRLRNVAGEAMGVHVGIGPWDSDKWRLFEAYEREVVAAVEAQAQGVAA